MSSTDAACRSFAVAVTRWLAIAPAAACGVLVAASTAGAGETGIDVAPAPARSVDVADGRAGWTTPRRAGRSADGRADWILPVKRSRRPVTELGVTETPSPAPGDEARWLDVIVDGELKRVPRQPSTRSPAAAVPVLPEGAESPVSRSAAEAASGFVTDEASGPLPRPVPRPVPRSGPLAADAPTVGKAGTDPEPDPVPWPSAPGIARALPVREDRPPPERSSASTDDVPGAARPPSKPAADDTLLDWLHALGIDAGRYGWPCPTPREEDDPEDPPFDPVSAVTSDDALRRAVVEFALALDRGVLDAGVSRDWALLRIGCEPGPERAGAGDTHAGTDAGAPKAGDGDTPSDVADSVADEDPEVPMTAGEDARSDGSGSVTSGLFIIDDDVPAGFERLAAPQSVWADVRFNGRVVGTTALTTTADEILFDLPADVVAMLDGIEDPGRLVELLSAPLPPNADRVCFRRGDPVGCGVVEPTPVAVVYDENTLTIDLFVAGALQRVRARETTRYLPAPERRPTSILSLNSAASRTPGTEERFDLSGRLLAAYGGGHVSVAGDYGSVDERSRLTEMKLTHFSDGHELTAGTYGWGVGGALVDVPLLGVGFSTSFRTRLDMEQAFASELVVYLPRRAIVQLVVDGRIQTGDSYEAGKQALDTRALPDGTYPVEIRIIESDGTIRSELRTFSKSASIPPRGEPVFGVTAGIARLDDELLPEGTEPLVAGFNVAQRLGDRAALTVGALQLGRDGFGQTELVYLGERLSLQGAFTLGRERTFGTTLNAGLSFSETRFGASYRSFRSDLARDGDAVRENFLPEDGEQWSVGADRMFARLAVGLSASRSRERTANDAPRDTTQYVLRARRSLFRRRDLRGNLAATLRESGGERFATLELEIGFGRGALTSGLGFDARGDESGSVGFGQSANVGYAARDHGFDWKVGLRARRGTTDSAGGRLGVEHALFRASASHDADFLDGGETSASSVAAFSTVVGLDRRGLAVGGTEASQAGVIVAVDGEPRGSPFDIVVNGTKTAVGQIGGASFIGLQPFESYAVKLIPRGVLSNGLGTDVHEFTLFPGNVHRIDADAEVHVLLIAELVDERGETLVNAVVETGDNPSVTGLDGLLQAEVGPGTVLEVRPVDGGTCRITTPEAPPDTEVLVADAPLVCRSGPTDGG